MPINGSHQFMSQLYQIAQLNLAHLLAPIDSPQLAEFTANLDRVNTLAESSPGFIWRLQTEDGDATGIDYFGPDVIVNMSTWADTQSLFDFVYQSDHIHIMKKRKAWFAKMPEMHMALWWIPVGTEPSLEMADERLRHLKQHGPTEYAFSLKSPFPAPK